VLAFDFCMTVEQSIHPPVPILTSPLPQVLLNVRDIPRARARGAIPESPGAGASPRIESDESVQAAWSV
jgi:hypothetical protein